MSLASLQLHDPAIAGLDVLGDGSALAGVLAAAGERLVGRCYLRYKPGTSVVLGLRLASGPAFAYAVSRPAGPKLTKLAERAPHGAVIHHSDAGPVLIARPAADRDLPSLARPDRWVSALGAGARTSVGNGRLPDGCRTLAYKPQRRWVGRLADDSTAVLRAYRPADLTWALAGWQIADAVAQTGLAVRLPRVEDSSQRYGVAAVSWLPGVPLDRLLGADSTTGETSTQRGTLLDEETWTSLGVALVGVHGALEPAPVGTPRTSRLAPPGLLRAGASVVREAGAVLPELRSRTERLLRRLAAAAPYEVPVSPVHGDFSTDQVIVGSDGLGIADWDRAGWGDPAVDVGSLRSADLPPAAYDAVLAGYRTIRDVPGAVDWYAAATGLLRLSEPLRTCRPSWRTDVDDRLTDLEGRSARLDAHRAGA